MVDTDKETLPIEKFVEKYLPQQLENDPVENHIVNLTKQKVS